MKAEALVRFLWRQEELRLTTALPVLQYLGIMPLGLLAIPVCTVNQLNTKRSVSKCGEKSQTVIRGDKPTELYLTADEDVASASEQSFCICSPPSDPPPKASGSRHWRQREITGWNFWLSGKEWSSAAMIRLFVQRRSRRKCSRSNPPPPHPQKNNTPDEMLLNTQMWRILKTQCCSVQRQECWSRADHLPLCYVT